MTTNTSTSLPPGGKNKSKNEPHEDHVLEKMTELRLEVESGEPVKITLRKGLAEMFGTELKAGHTYNFDPGSKVAIFTWHGAVIRLTGKPEVAYVARETPMTYYANLARGIEELCEKAEKEESGEGKGPTVLIVGPTDVGKSTLVRILLNYAVKWGRTPIYVDLDVGQGSISIPGTVGSVVVERPADIEKGFSLAAPCVWHYGHTGPGGNDTLYKLLISRLAQVCTMRMEAEKKVKSSGIVINTCGWVKGFGYHAICHAASEFEVDLIVVLDQERLFNDLKRDFQFVKVIFAPKSGGVVERTRAVRVEARDAKVRWYFYGYNNELYPYSFDISFTELKAYKIGAPNLPASCLPIGMTSEDNLTKLVRITSAKELVHHVLAVSSSKSIEDNMEVIKSNVLGFICVTALDDKLNTLTILSPQPRPLPHDCILLLSDIEFMDSH